MDDHSSSRRPPQEKVDRPPRTSSPNEDTASLINRAQTGDSAALERLCERYLPRLYRWATGRLPPQARRSVETSDLVQETFLKVLRQLGSYETRQPGTFPVYLRKAILNRLRDEIRRAKVKPETKALDGSELDSSPSPLERTIGREQAERYEKALRKLKEDDRAAIFLRVELELSYKHIGDALNRPSADAARMAVKRALIRLAGEMRNDNRPG